MMMTIMDIYVPLPPKPIIALPRMKAFMDGAAAVSAEPMANRSLETTSIFLLSKKTSNFPLMKILGHFHYPRLDQTYQKRQEPPRANE